MGNNKWIDHVKKYAKEHNLSYACALSQKDIKNNYEKVIKKVENNKSRYLAIPGDSDLPVLVLLKMAIIQL
jgi:hypothetical protein